MNSLIIAIPNNYVIDLTDICSEIRLSFSIIFKHIHLAEIYYDIYFSNMISPERYYHSNQDNADLGVVNLA